MFYSRMSTFAAVLALVRTGIAVCASGQMAVGKSSDVMFTGGPSHDFSLWSGFLMSNNCRLISQNGATASEAQLCAGGYFKGASVQCDASANRRGRHAGEPLEVFSYDGWELQCVAGGGVYRAGVLRPRIVGMCTTSTGSRPSVRASGVGEIFARFGEADRPYTRHDERLFNQFLFNSERTADGADTRLCPPAA
ncbi:hypothetical protein PsYK624_095510 [Phanerochaete sordida]|uniref:Uncharacterized protein n=1 Tax=Phanerochaete sordida TaxID=48140 RepID=A0A9P3GEM7_9APHY|nr:hypothetical protein PsYK624_095510 [Phanerochaete sordida]